MNKKMEIIEEMLIVLMNSIHYKDPFDNNIL